MKTPRHLPGSVTLQVGLLFATFIPAAFAQSTKSLSVDLDGDGRLERIAWEEFANTDDHGSFLQLVVYDPAGKAIWKGPAVTDPENPLVFGEWHFGLSVPEIVTDIDNDGAIELIAPAPQSDVSPTQFRILRWIDGAFSPVQQAALLESGRGTGTFRWSDEEIGEGTWISAFVGINGDGSLQVDFTRYVSGEAMRAGKANVTVADGGFRVRDWTSPLQTSPLQELP